MNDVDFLIKIICSIVSDKFATDEVHYLIQFLLCSCQLTRSERQKIMKHKSSVKKQEIAKRKRENYTAMEPAKKSLCKAEKYRAMDPKKRQDLQSNNAEKYRSMDPKKTGSSV